MTKDLLLHDEMLLRKVVKEDLIPPGVFAASEALEQRVRVELIQSRSADHCQCIQ